MAKPENIPAKLLSQLAFAKLRGVTHGAVAKAIKSGRLSKCLHQTDGKLLIDPVVGALEWDANTNSMKKTNGAGAGQQAAGLPALESREGVAVDEQGIMLTRGELHKAAAGASLADSRALKELYMAKLAQLEYETKSGKLIETSLARTTAFDTARKARDMLNTIADRLAPVVAGLADQFECHKVITAEIRRVQAELSANPIDEAVARAQDA